MQPTPGSAKAPREGVTRRTFLGTTAAASLGVVGSGAGALWARGADAADLLGLEHTIPELQTMMSEGRLSSRELTMGYLRRIETLNPLLHAVIETNPEAIAIAAQRDEERRRGLLRGPLHGIPILVKDNVATADQMQTAAGSLALVGSRVPADAAVTTRLRAAGAVILGKANLSEWANFRGFTSLNFNGWSARGGKTRDPYALGFDPCGSSAGSAAGVAANLCAAAVGTETDGSIVCPAGNNLVFGLKPTLGLISQAGIIPIAHSQDTAGPIARSVTDLAVMLGVMRSPFGDVVGRPLPIDYTTGLDAGSLAGKTIAVDTRFLQSDYSLSLDTAIADVFRRRLDVLTSLGATVIECDTGDIFAYSGDEFTVLLTEFKVQVAEYLAGLSHTSMRSLADLIAFNQRHCAEEMPYYGQEIFELAEETSGDLTDPAYVQARANCVTLSRTEGIDRVLATGVDAIVAPSYSFATQAAAVAGYPNISIPLGLTDDGRPAGMWMYAGFLDEPKLLSFAFAIEQALQPRRQPGYLGTLQPFPPDPGLCQAPAAHAARRPAMPHLGMGRPLRRR